MPATQEELPSTLERSSEKVKRTYMEALDAAHREYGEEARAHRVAWSAVKHIAEKKGDRWVLKDRTHGGGTESKPKRELYEDARRAGVEGRSRMSKHELVEALERDRRGSQR
jgi:cation transport regulator ChaB